MVSALRSKFYLLTTFLTSMFLTLANNHDPRPYDNNQDFIEIKSLSSYQSADDETQNLINNILATVEENYESYKIRFYPPDRVSTIALPEIEELDLILSEFNSRAEGTEKKLNNYVVGLKQEKTILTLKDTYENKIFSEVECALLLHEIKDFNDGEIKTVKMTYGPHKDELLVVGKVPQILIPFPKEPDNIEQEDASLAPFVKWLELLGHITWVRPFGAGESAGVLPQSEMQYFYSLYSLAAGISATYYDLDQNANLYAGANLSGTGIGTSAGYGGENLQHSVWYSISSGWNGLGYSGIYNLEEQQFGLSGLGLGAFVAGWKNYVQVGSSLNTIFTSSNQSGMGAILTLSKNRVSTYLHSYHGQYDELIQKYLAAYKSLQLSYAQELSLYLIAADFLDHQKRTFQHDLKSKVEDTNKKFNLIKHSIERLNHELSFFKNKHFIEVYDSDSKGLRLQGGFYASGFGMGFRGEKAGGHSSIHRFYAPLQRTQQLLKDGDGTMFAALRLPKKFDTEEFPDMSKPHTWHLGEEVVTHVARTFTGSIVMGIYGLPTIAGKVGVSKSVTGNFELGVRRLPMNQVEVTIRPQNISEMGGFIAFLQGMGFQAGVAGTVSLAMRQSFVFDLNHPYARAAYLQLINAGELPIDFSDFGIIAGQRQAEDILDLAERSRLDLAQKGILLTYLEKIDVPVRKFFIGVGKIPFLKSKHWAGLSYEYLRGVAHMISTNGQIAISRATKALELKQGLGLSGERSRKTYSTIKRKFIKLRRAGDNIKDSSSDVYQWEFGGLIMRAHYTDSKITSDNQNYFIDEINSRFKAGLKPYPKEYEPQKQSREVTLERTLGSEELDRLPKAPISKIIRVSKESDVSVEDLSDFLNKLERIGHNRQAEIINHFLGKHGISGFSAIHLLLDGGSQNLLIRASSNCYTEPLSETLKLEAKYTKTSETGDSLDKINLSEDSSKNEINKAYKAILKNIRYLDMGLEELYLDPYFYEEANAEDLIEGDLVQYKENNLREAKTLLKSKLISAKEKLLSLIDLREQDFDLQNQIEIYEKLKEKRRGYYENLIVLEHQYQKPISVGDRRKTITTRYMFVTKILKQIEQEKEKLLKLKSRRIYGSKYTLTRLSQINEYRERFKELIKLTHLVGAKDFLQKMLAPRWIFFPPKEIHKKIAKITKKP